jgi:hypothetical protein
MTEQSQMPLVGPPKRRGWREIVWFRPLTPSTHAALVVTRRGRLVSILPAGGPRVLSDYLAWPYDFREVDTRERLLVLDQRLESFDSSYEFSVSLRLIYQVAQPDRVALDLEDVSTELAHAVVQSLRLSGRSFGVERDNTFEEHLQETLINGDALIQRVQLLGLVLRRANVTVTLDEPTRAHAEALRFAMRERPLHFQVAVESLEPDRSFDVLVGGAYRLTNRRAQDGPSDTTDSAIQLAITRTLRRIGITFAPSDYPSAAKAMAEVLHKDALLQSELSMVQAQLLRPTVQIQPDRSMVHVPRPNVLEAPDMRPAPMLRRDRQGLPRISRPPALVDMQESAPQQAPPPAVPRALPPPESQPADIAASRALPLGELPVPGDPIEGAYTLWPLPESMPIMRALPTPGQPHDAQDADAPWAGLFSGAEEETHDHPWSATPSTTLSELVEPLPWKRSALDEADQPAPEEQAPQWSATPPPRLSAPVEPLPWERSAMDDTDQPAFGAALAAEDSWSGRESIAEPEIASDEPEFLKSDLADDLGFSLDWSEPEVAAHVAESPASAPASTADSIADDLDFTLDWSEPQLDSYASAWAPSADTTTDDSIITAHWDDQTIAVPEPAIFSDPPTVAYTSADIVTVHLDPASVFDLDPAQLDREQARPAGLPTVAEQGAEQDVAQSVIEQESPPWYAPTMQLDDHLPLDSAADDSGYTSLETFEGAWAEQPAAPSAPADDLAADAFSQLPNEALDQAPTTTIEPASDLAPGDASELMAARVEPAAEISVEKIARIIGMIQSYGPAWFKMWSLELKERPERLPIVLGEVTADPVLLAQADDPRVQSALLLALAAYTSPTAFPARLATSASLPSPAIAGQSNDGEDEVPDWLSLRVKWNGHGGGA